MVLGDGNYILRPCLFEELYPGLGIEFFGTEAGNEVLVAAFVESAEALKKVVVRRVAWPVHVMRIPLIDRARDSVDTPADEDAEFGVPEPLGNRVVAQGFPVRTKRSFVGLLIGQLQQSIAPAIESGNRLLPFLVDLFRRFDPVRGSPSVRSLGGELRCPRGGITRLGRRGRRRRADPRQQQKDTVDLHFLVLNERQEIAKQHPLYMFPTAPQVDAPLLPLRISCHAMPTKSSRLFDIPMYVNAWLQQPNHAWPGTYPSGGPLPQVHDIWRAGAPDIDILAPDLYLEYFDSVCERFIRNGNPLFIPETSTNPANAIVAVGRFNTIGFSPFGIDGNRPIPPELAATYSLLNQMSPMILAHQGMDSITAVRLNQGDPPKHVKLGNYTLTLIYTGRNVHIAPQPKGESVPSQSPSALQAAQESPLEAAAILISTDPDEYYFAGGGVRIDFTANTPGPQNVGLGDVQQGNFVDGKWVVTRQIAGDDDAQGEILILRPYTILRVTLYRFP